MSGDPRRKVALALGSPAGALGLGGCDLRVGNPDALWLLWLVAGLALFFAVGLRVRRRSLARFASPRMLERLGAFEGGRRRALKAVLVTVALSAMVLSLARLQYGFTWEEVERRGVDVVVAVDVSDSMLVKDAGPAGGLGRLERARREVTDLLRVMRGDRIAIVAFAGTAFVHCPLTMDYGAAGLFVEALDTDLVPVQGTDLAQGLEASLGAFEGGRRDARAVILISDGEDHSGRVQRVAQRAAEQGVRVYAIGVGSTQGAPIPSPGGGLRRDRAGQIVMSRLDETTLQRVAVATDGRYVRSVSGDLDLEQIYLAGLKRHLEDQEQPALRRRRWQDRFQWLLLAAAGLLMAEALIAPGATTRRRRRA